MALPESATVSQVWTHHLSDGLGLYESSLPEERAQTEEDTPMSIKISNDMKDVTYVICTPATDPSPFPDNVRGHCSLCGLEVQHRPHVPPGVPLACTNCYTTKLKGNEQTDNVVVSPITVVEVLQATGVKTKFAECCMAGFVGWGVSTGFKRSEPGTKFTCPTCGRIFALIARTPDAAPVWTLVEYGVQ